MQDSSNDKPHNPHIVDPDKLAGNTAADRRRDPSVVTPDEVGIYLAPEKVGGAAGDSNVIPAHEPRDPSAGHVTADEAKDITAEDIGVNPVGHPRDAFNPHNIVKESFPVSDVNNKIPPEMADVPAEAGPLDLPPNRSRMLRHSGPRPQADREEPGSAARAKVKDRSMKARAKRVWNWIKFIMFLIIAGLIAFGYYAYENRKQGYVVEPRTCLFETEDKQVRFTGTRYYSYMQNSMFGLRWHLDADTTVKTELDIKGDALVILSWGGKGNPTSKYISTGERGTVPLAPADMWVITLDKRSVVLESTKFCR